jgi:hypothetical protein
MSELITFNSGQVVLLSALAVGLVVTITFAIKYTTRTTITLTPHFAPKNAIEVKSWMVVLFFVLTLGAVGRCSGQLLLPAWTPDHLLQLGSSIAGLIASVCYYKGKGGKMPLVIILLSAIVFFVGVSIMPQLMTGM